MKYDSSRSKPLRAKKSGGGTLLGVFIGLIVGIVVAASVVWFMNRTPFKDTRSSEAKAAAVPQAPAAATTAAPGTPEAQADAPLPLPGKPGDKPRFEFYKILPSGQAGAPSADPKQATAPAAPAAPTAAPPATTAPPPAAAAIETYYLQVGAYQKSDDAEGMKGRIALIGLDAIVQQVSSEKGPLYRVRLGAFAKPEEMNRVRAQLSQNGIQTTIIKVKSVN